MGQKKPFALRIDKDVLEAVEKWAADEFRSSNGQLEWIIVKALKEAGRMPKPGKTDEVNETDSEEPTSKGMK